jgi:arsenate reductase
MTENAYNVLFLCTGNSARSNLSECLINHWGRGRFRGFSAGSHPKVAVHPIALALLEHVKLPAEGLRSKSWGEFEALGGLRLDFVFTVRDNAAGQDCPVWPRQPMTAHGGVSDPAAAEWPQFEQRTALRAARSRCSKTASRSSPDSPSPPTSGSRSRSCSIRLGACAGNSASGSRCDGSGDSSGFFRILKRLECQSLNAI